MAETKTRPTKVSVDEFIDKVPDEQKRKDSYELIEMMEKITHEKPVMWGPSIIGFGKYHYKYSSGHEGDLCIAGFSPRKTALTIYLALMVDKEKNNKLLAKLGKHKTGVSCLYVKRLADIDKKILEELIKRSINSIPAWEQLTKSN